VFLQGRWIDSGVLDLLRVESATNVPNSIDDNSVASTFYTDLNLSYTMGADDNLEIYGNVTNLFDRAPVVAPLIIGRAGTTEFNPALYDVVGRRYVVGFDYKF
jgi:outer membrane receptor protein involved in Fe transport